MANLRKSFPILFILLTLVTLLLLIGLPEPSGDKSFQQSKQSPPNELRNPVAFTVYSSLDENGILRMNVTHWTESQGMLSFVSYLDLLWEPISTEIPRSSSAYDPSETLNNSIRSIFYFPEYVEEFLTTGSVRLIHSTAEDLVSGACGAFPGHEVCAFALDEDSFRGFLQAHMEAGGEGSKGGSASPASLSSRSFGGGIEPHPWVIEIIIPVTEIEEAIERCSEWGPGHATDYLVTSYVTLGFIEIYEGMDVVESVTRCFSGNPPPNGADCRCIVEEWWRVDLKGPPQRCITSEIHDESQCDPLIVCSTEYEASCTCPLPEYNDCSGRDQGQWEFFDHAIYAGACRSNTSLNPDYEPDPENPQGSECGGAYCLHPGVCVGCECCAEANVCGEECCDETEECCGEECCGEGEVCLSYESGVKYCACEAIEHSSLEECLDNGGHWDELELLCYIDCEEIDPDVGP